MARTPVLTKTQILEAAFNIMNGDGPDNITIRSIAKRLNKSTAPIYTQYDNRESIMIDLEIYVKDQLFKNTLVQRTVNNFLNIGVGILDFALNNKKVFSYYYLTKGLSLHGSHQGHREYLEHMKKNDLLTVLDDACLNTMLDDMSVYTYGLAVMICNGLSKETSLEYYINKLEQMGNQLISYHLYSTGNYEAYIQKIFQKISKVVDLEEVLK